MMLFVSFISFCAVIVLSLGFGLLFTYRANRYLTFLERLIVGLTVGSVAWMLLIYATSWIHMRPLSLIIFILGSGCGWWKNRKVLLDKIGRFDWILCALLFVGVLGQLFLVAPSGITYADGMRFYGVNSHDGMWHVTLMQSLSTTFPPELPTYAGATLKGYHYLIDLWGSEFARIFRIPAVDLTFRWFPLFFSVLTGCGVFILLKRLTRTKLARYFGVFLTYFAGSLGYVLTLLGHEGHAGETAFWAQQSISTFINLPLGASFTLITTSLLLLVIFFQSKQDVRLLWLTALMVGTSISVKAYGGILMVGAFCAILFLFGIINKKKYVIGPLLLVLVLVGALILPQLQPGYSSFLYEPGWFLKTMMETSDRVNYPLWELQRQTYAAHNSVFRVAEYWLIAFFIFLVGNMGIRMIGFIPMIKRFFSVKKEAFYLEITMLLIVVGGIAIPMIFLQTGVVWNAIQFTYYSLFVMNIFTAIAVDQIPHNRLRVLFVILFIALTVPTTIKTLSNYYQGYLKSDSYLLIPNEKLRALQFIKSLPDSAKLLTAYSDVSYVPAMTGKTVYYVDDTQASILLLPLDRRRVVTRIFCQTPGDVELKDMMQTNQLNYLYASQSKNADCHPNFDSNPFLTKVFSNALSAVYRLN